METICLLLHTEADGSLGRASLEAVTAATQVSAQLGGAPVHVGLVGSETQPAANRLGNCGAQSFNAVTGPEFGVARYRTDAAAAEAICRAVHATLVLAPATSRWNRVLPGVAHRLGGRADTHITGVSGAAGAVSVNRWYYRQRMEAVLHRPSRPWIILLESGNYEAWQGPEGTAQVKAVTASPPEASRTQVVGTSEPKGDAQTIRPDAKLLFVAGAGWTKKQADGQAHIPEAETLISDCLKLTQASLGSTKSLVDIGGDGESALSFLTHFNQVGQTGSTPRHPKGLATCCHGEEPHTVGWRFVRERRAVNLDPNCGWARGKADVLYVADAFAVVARLNEILAQGG